MLPKITITIEGPSCQGIGKTTVAQIIERALKQYKYEVAHTLVPAADNPTPMTTDALAALNRIYPKDYYKITPEESRPRAVINLIETT